VTRGRPLARPCGADPQRDRPPPWSRVGQRVLVTRDYDGSTACPWLSQLPFGVHSPHG
jgi:hypothetical protein